MKAQDIEGEVEAEVEGEVEAEEKILDTEHRSEMTRTNRIHQTLTRQGSSTDWPSFGQNKNKNKNKRHERHRPIGDWDV